MIAREKKKLDKLGRTCYMTKPFRHSKIKRLKRIKKNQKLPSFVKFAEAATNRCSMNKGVLRNFTTFTRKHLHQSLIMLIFRMSRS